MRLGRLLELVSPTWALKRAQHRRRLRVLQQRQEALERRVDSPEDWYAFVRENRADNYPPVERPAWTRRATRLIDGG